MEIVYTPKGYRGFKSLLLRHKKDHILMDVVLFLYCEKESFENRIQIAGSNLVVDGWTAAKQLLSALAATLPLHSQNVDFNKYVC